MFIELESICDTRHLEKSFFRFCLWRCKKLVRYIFLYWVVAFGAFFHFVNREKYLAIRWRFLRDVPELERLLRQFWKKRKIWRPDGTVVVVTDHPCAVVQTLCEANNWKLLANEYDTERAAFEAFETKKQHVPEHVDMACGPVFSWILKRADCPVYRYTVLGKKRTTRRKKLAVSLAVVQTGIVWIGLILYAVLLGYMSLFFAGRAFADYTALFEFYLSSALLVRLNIAPVIWLAVFCYLLFNRAYMAVLVTSAVTMILTWINYFKLLFRDDPFLIEDILIAMEARMMAGQYNVEFSKGMLLAVFLILLACVLFFLFARQRVRNTRLRVIALGVTIAIGCWGFSNSYMKDTYYYQIPATDMLNQWSDTDNFMRRGFIYPFLNSAKNAVDQPPSGYNEKNAEERLNEYQYYDIPEDQKVHVIAIMLEAYGDFTRFEEVEFADNPYEYFQQLSEEAYSGILLNNIFAAGTINTERCFMTGYTKLPSFRSPTNSYGWYFAEQGYTVEGSHPSYDWFYNRVNTNPNLGFENYYFDENMYMALNEGQHTANNDILLPNIVKLFEESAARGEHYFSFNVTYQGHGPYSAEPAFETPYIANQNLSEADFNTINNYFYKMDQVDASVEEMIETLRFQDEPVVVILFGDHMPWMGDGNSIYDALGINLDISTPDGFMNYYQTPYLIWANDAAEDTLGREFVGEGPMIGPYFLMNQFFELAGYTGNQYMQYSNEVMDTFAMIHDNGFYYIDGELCTALTEEQQTTLQEFLQVQYYWRHHFKSQ